MKHLIYLDSEFTDLFAPELLSIGMVTADGQEHYLELDRDDPVSAPTFAKVSEFVRHSGVLAQWGVVPESATTAREMGRRTGQWLLDKTRGHGPLILAFDYVVDYELVEAALRDAGLWDVVREVVLPLRVGVLTGTSTGEEAAEQCFAALRARGLSRHHALADALALRTAHLAVSAQWGASQ
jgi:hypothetical protein